MALLFIEGFDHYGIGDQSRTQMLAGVYAEVYDANAGEFEPVATRARTGAYSFYAPFTPGVDSSAPRRIFGGAKTSAGSGAAFWLENLPAGGQSHVLFAFTDFNNVIQITIGVSTTGAIEIYRGSYSIGTQLAVSADGAIVTDAWTHVEAKVTIDNSAGAAEVRVNGVTVCSCTGVDTQASALSEVSQVALFRRGSIGASDAPTYVDDWYAWDTLGGENNDFMGDLRVGTYMPNMDTAQDDWTPSTGTDSYAMIDEIPADDDTTYIETETVGDITAVHFANLPTEVASIRGIQTYAKQRKTVPGICSTQIAVISGSSDDLGTDNAITEQYTYYMDVFEQDPATGAPWTRTGVNDALVQIERTA